MATNSTGSFFKKKEKTIDKILGIANETTKEKRQQQDAMKTPTDLTRATNGGVVDKLLGKTSESIKNLQTTPAGKNSNATKQNEKKGSFFSPYNKDSVFGQTQSYLKKGVRNAKNVDVYEGQRSKWLKTVDQNKIASDVAEHGNDLGNLNRIYTEGTADQIKNPRAYATDIALLKKMGQAGDKNYAFMNDYQLSTKRAELEGKRDTALEKEKNYRENLDELKEENENAATQQGIYHTLADRGVPFYTRFGDYQYFEPNEWNQFYDDDFLKAKPEDYYDGNMRETYDRAMYDALYGEGAYEKRIDALETNEDAEALESEMDNYWSMLENGGFDEKAVSAQENYFETMDNLQGDFGSKRYQNTIDKIAAQQERNESLSELEANRPNGTTEYNPELVQTRKQAVHQYGLSGVEVARTIEKPVGDKTDQAYFYANHLPEEGWTLQQIYENFAPEWFLDEKTYETFMDYYNNNDKESAQAVLDGAEYFYQQIAMEAKGALEQLMAADGDYWLQMSIYRTLTPEIAGLLSTIGAVEAMFNNEEAKKPWYWKYGMSNTNANISAGRQKSWGDQFAEWFGEGARGIGETGYKVTSSVVDNLRRNVETFGVSKMFGVPMDSALAKTFDFMLLGSDVIGDTFANNLAGGMDPEEAFVRAAGAGAIEIITENMWWDSVFSPDVKDMLGNPRQFAKYLSNIWNSEGFEEVSGTVMDAFYDEFISALYNSESELDSKYNALVDGGMDPAAAKWKVLGEWFDEIGESYLTGGFSAVFQGTGRTVAARTENNSVNKSYGKQAVNFNVAENATKNEMTTMQAVNRVGLVNIAKDMALGTDSRELGEKAYNDIMKGKKVSDADYGAIARALLNDTNGSIQASVSNILQERISEQMEEMGEKPENIEANAASLVNLIAGTATDADMVRYLTSESMKKLLSQYRMSNEGIGEKRAEVEEETQKAESIRETVSAMIAPRAEVSTKAIENVVKDAKVATQDEINKAEGKVTGNPLQVVTEGKIKEIAETKLEGDGDGKHIQVYFTDGTNADIADVKATNIGAAQVLEFANLNGNKTTSDAFTNALLRNVTKEGNAAALISGAMRIRWDVVTGQKTYNSGLDAKTAGELRTAAEADYAEAEARRLKNYRQINPGKGKTTYNGVAYGTKAFQEAIKGLNRDARTEAVTIGALAKSAGFDVELINDPNSTKEQGSYSANGGIVINLAGEYRDGVRRSALATLPHEITHWLEGNSPEAYKALRQFVLNTQKANGVNLEQRLQNIMDSYAKENVDLDMFDAVSEMVAKSCEEVLTDESVIRRLRESDPNTYGKVRKAVSMAITRVKEALGMAKATSSIYAQTIRDYADKLSDLWVKAYEEAKQVKGTGEGREAVQASVQESNGYDYLKGYEEQIDDVKNHNDIETEPVFVGEIPEVFKKLNMERLPLTISKGHIKEMLGMVKSADKNHVFDEYFVKNLPDTIAHPVAIIESRSANKGNNSIVLVLEKTNPNTGHNTIGAVEIQKSFELNKEPYDGYMVTSVHGRDNAINLLINAMDNEDADNHGVYYLNKKKAIALCKNSNVNVAKASRIKAFAKHGFIHTIDDNGSAVKSAIKKQTETTQFRRWFGNSVIKNEDGTPKIMYHGTLHGGFDVFNGGKDYWYFSDSKDYSKVFAGRKKNNTFYPSIRKGMKNGVYKPQIYEVYLSVQNPFITEDQDIVETALYWDRSLAEELRKKGYDALMMKDMSQVIVLNANQIKSATDNIGTFDKGSDSIKYSVQETDDAYMDAVKNGDEDLQQYYVNMAAEAAGYTDTAYHGTELFGFTEFDLKAGQDTVFVAYNKELASTYTRTDEVREISDRDGVPVNYYMMDDNELIENAVRVYRDWYRRDVLSIEREEGDDEGKENKATDRFVMKYRDEFKGEIKETVFRRFEILQALEEYQNPNGEYDGIYQLVTKPGRQLLIDAGGDDWNEIAILDKTIAKDILEYIGDEASGGFAPGPLGHTYTTRQIASYAKAHGYDSVRINNVHDNGGRNWNVEGEEAYGDIGIFFNPSDVKSADAVVYDDDGNIIPPSERFNPEKKDIRWSIQDETEGDIRYWMMSVKPESLQTEAEKELLNHFKDVQTRLDLRNIQIGELKEKIRRLESKETLNKDEKRLLAKWKIQLENAMTVKKSAEEELGKIVGSEGYGRMMKRQNRIFNDFMYGKTQAEVEEEIRGLQKRSEKINDEIEANRKRIAEIESKGVIAQLKKILGTTTADQTAAELKKEFHSSWTRNQLRTYIDQILLKLANGEDISSDVEEMAGILVSSDERNTNETLNGLRGLTITLGKGAQQELKAKHSSLKEIRARLAGTGITVKYGDRSTLEADIEDLREQYPEMPEMGSDKDALENFVSWVEGLKRSGADEFYDERLAEAMAQVFAKVTATAKGIYIPTEAKAQKQVMALIEYVKSLGAETQAAVDTMNRIAEDATELWKGSGRAAGLANVLTTNIGDALEYYDRTAKMALATAKKERNTQIIEQLKSENAQKIAKNNEEWRNLIERDKQAQRQAENNRVYRSRINTALKRTFNLLKNPKGMQNIPEYMQGLARELLETFVDNDLNEMRMQKITLADKGQLEEAKRLLEAWKKQDGEFNMADLNDAEDAVASVINMDLLTIYDGIAQLNGEIRGKNKLDTMTQRGEILRQVQEAVSEIYSAIRTEGKIQVNRRMIDVQDQAYRIATELNGKNRKEWTGKIGNVMNVLHKGIVSGNMTPEYFFRTIGNAGLTELWNNYHDAENRNGLELKKAQTRLAEIAEKHGYDKWDMKQKITLPLESGDVTLTLGQLMSLWATWKRENTLGPAMSEHLTKGGFYAEEDTRDGLLGRRTIEKKAHRVTAADMQRVEAMLTDEQLAFIDDVVGYMSTDMSELGNEASMAAYGIKMYKEGYYFPFQMWDGIRSRKSNDSGSAAAAQDRAFHPSFSKSRLHGANNALVIGDFMQTAADHIAGMINYATMGLANESLQKTLNLQLQENEDAGVATKRNVWTMMEEAYGQEAMQYLRELQKQLNGGAVKIDKTFYDKLISLFRKNAVAGSLSVALQQPLSYIRAAMMMNPKYLAQALNPALWKGSYKEMLAHSGVAVIKDMGRFDMNFGQSAREFLTPDGLESRGKKIWNGIEEYSTKLPELMDRMTWTRMWSAVKAEQKALHPEMDAKSEEFLDLCGERFNDIMRRTQVYDSVLVKSANMRSQNAFMKTMTSFMAEPTLTLNVLADSVRMAKNGEAGGKAMVGKAAATFILSAVLQAAVKGLMGSGRTPDEKKTWLENFMYKFEYNFLNEIDVAQLVPGFSDAVTLLKGGELKDDALNTIKKMIDAYGKIGDILNGGGWRAVEDSIGQIVQMYSGVPMKNLMRDGRAMWNWFIDQPYADRETSGAVLKGQATDLFFNADNMLGVVNKWLGDAGYDTSNMGYYEQIYNAKKRGDEQAELDLIDYLINGKGMKAETIESKVNSIAKKDESMSAAETSEFLISQGSDSADDYIRDQLKQGNMTAAEARKELKKAQPDKDENEIWWTVDRIEYAKETGNKVSGNSYYYRLEDAINSNSANAIKAAVQELTAHGVPKDNVKKKLSDWKKAYLGATGNEKVRIKNALIMAYKALGYSETEANEIINKWK